MRKFRIIGKVDGEFDLNNETYFLHSPENLGISIKNEYLKVFNLRIKVDEQVEFEDFTGELMIASYIAYEALRKFIARNRVEGFYFFYTDGINDERFIDCDFTMLSKTELNSFKRLFSKIKITPRTYWQKTTVTTSNVVVSEGEGKKYELQSGELDPLFRYAYQYKLQEGETDPLFRYGYVYSSPDIGRAYILNDGDFAVPSKIVIYGPGTNPMLQLYDSQNKEISNAKINILLKEAETLIINSSPDNLRISLIDEDGKVYDKTEEQDFSKTNYIILPVGESYLIVSSDEEGELISAKIEWQNTYLGV